MEENLISMREDHSFHVRYRMEASCLELALEGERLCKSGDCRAGVSFFEAAVQVGTEDLKTLSAIYSQLGNAYFYLHDYAKALEYHHHDLTLARTIGDQLGEAKASGNLGNTLKVLGNFDEAVVCCQQHLDISRELNDKVGEARALYNLGNVYHAKGKSFGYPGPQDTGELPEEVRDALQAAVDYYEENLSLVTALGDRAAQGRAFGNLGNTHYLLGNFRDAVIAHEQRLLIAKEFGDKAAERRAYSNLGNAYIFLGEFETASEYYKKTLLLARQLKDRAVEAQSCYSLGNTYTLLQDYEKAIDYHLKHLAIAQELNDRIGEGRACWSLGNAYTALGNHDQAMHFAEKHLEISREVGDRSGELTARLNLSDLQMVLGLSYSTNSSIMSENIEIDNSLHGARPKLGRRRSMENMELMKLTPEKKISADTIGDEAFFDLLSQFQSNRMDDQRCCFQEKNYRTASTTTSSTPHKMMLKTPSVSVMSPNTDEFLDLLASSQSRRLDDQRASFSNLPGLHLKQNNKQSVLDHLITNDNKEPDEDFFDILVKCQGSRLDDQRCAPPPAATKGPTVPDEDFFSLILRSQAKRMDEQRVLLQRDQDTDAEFGLKDLLQSNALLEFKTSEQKSANH
ncbi:G-protein-signaling modulator 2 isoform X2 [Trichechus manatus latirostris]|uniref:G-protein-signaling modulator 2 isoform X2 n=1 Tax=Trichechus manatus latirostris TaxID=127582 RepID=A0A2Y9RWJ7_TRIMA|nr:G-protein-signaling modulator 2 isoform X2 [Trichechus manatus latirostris]